MPWVSRMLTRVYGDSYQLRTQKVLSGLCATEREARSPLPGLSNPLERELRRAGLQGDSPFVSSRAALGSLVPLPPQGTWSLDSRMLALTLCCLCWVRKEKGTSVSERGGSRTFVFLVRYQRRYSCTCLGRRAGRV